MTFSSGLGSNGLFGTPVNNAILDPLQGFDADIWVIDQATGNYNLVGRFTSFQTTIRNSTELYLEFNQRIPRLLDGVFNFGFVLERGMLDARILQQTFGYNAITRELRNDRNTRFQISFSVSAPGLQNEGKTVQSVDLGNFGTKGDGSSRIANETFANRLAVGEYVLTNCKVDTFTMGATSGQNVIANRWEGMFEGIEFVERSTVDPGVFLSAVNSSVALQVGAEAATNIKPFAWDKIIYENNLNQSGTRTANPLAEAYGGRLPDRGVVAN